MSSSGSQANALGREMATNFEVYMDTGLTAHAIRYLKIEAGVNKYEAKGAWGRANRHRPARPGPLTLAEHQRNLRDPPDTPVKVMAEELVILARHHPVLLHRFLLGAVERRQAAAMDANEDEERRFERTGKTFPLFPLRTVKVHFATLDVKIINLWLKENAAVKANVARLGIADKDLLKAFFPRRKGGWTPANELKTDSVRVALTYERRVLKRTAGSDSTKETKDKRKRAKKNEAQNPAADPDATDVDCPPATSSSSSSSSSPSSSPSPSSSASASAHVCAGHVPDGDGDPPDPPPPVPAVLDAALPPPPKTDIRTAPKGMYYLEELVPDASLVFENPGLWEAFDPGLTTLYEGHHDTRMSRRKWRYETGAERAVKQANGRDLINILPVLQHLPDGSLKSASVQVLSQRLRDVWVFHWGQLWAHYGVRWWGQQRFRQAIKHQRVLDHIADQVLGPKHDRIAVFGDGVFPPSMKGIPPAPVTMVRDYLARKGRVVLLDEGLTSKTCCQCHSVMRQHASLHATKHCKSAIHTWSWNRDVNAARNIAYLWKCYMAGLDRPAAFRPRPRLPARNTLHRVQPGSDPSAGL